MNEEPKDNQIKRLRIALQGLLDAEGHVIGCGFSACTCGAVAQRGQARGYAARVLNETEPKNP